MNIGNLVFHADLQFVCHTMTESAFFTKIYLLFTIFILILTDYLPDVYPFRYLRLVELLKIGV